MRSTFIAAAAATSALFLAAVAGGEPPSQPQAPAPGPPKDPARVAIEACHEAVVRELKNPETIDYRGDSIYRAAIEIIVNGSLSTPKNGGYYDYTCRYNERSKQVYGVTVEKGTP